MEKDVILLADKAKGGENRCEEGAIDSVNKKGAKMVTQSDVCEGRRHLEAAAEYLVS